MSAPTGYITADPTDLQLFVADTNPLADPTVNVYDFVMDGLQPGGLVKRRQIAESLYMDDATQAQSSKARVPSNFGMFVTGYDGSNLQDNVEALIAAIDVAVWEMHVTLDGAEYAWSCWDAEYTPGFPVQTWYGIYLPVQIQTLRSPIPVTGPI